MMNNIINKLTAFMLVLALVFAGTAIAKEDVNKNSDNSPSNTTSNRIAADCAQTSSQTDLAINNIRTTILVGGDMWWDLNNPKYEVPIGSSLHSLFAGALWIGGVDAGGQIKVAAQTYRQTGIDFWGGPVNTATVDIDAAECVKYDRHWQISKEEVSEFREKQGTSGYTPPNVIQTWPGNGDPSKMQDQFLAPFEDINGDGFYDWTAGDYPKYDFGGSSTSGCDDFLFGDATLWWVFNDVGNVHTESTSIQPLGLEIRAQAFGFKTNDEINNMTFYKYEIINRSFQSLNNTYFGQWVDPDLGNFQDDYVGCDVTRGLGYCYNGDADDETVDGYGLNPPCIGVDFFQGPLADPGDGIDNDRDGTIDEVDEQIIMSKFVYYNNVNSSPTGNPAGFADFYNYLQGIWLDGQKLTYGGDGRDPNGDECNFMFPDDTDPAFASTPWTEATAGNPPADRRFLQTAGPFTLLPGAVNFITTGVVWARASSGGPLASIPLMQAADDKAQALFDNCFKLVDGPDAPDLVIRELDKKLIFSLENTSGPFVEQYAEIDPTISTLLYSDNVFRFEGYQIFQLADNLVTLSEESINDPDQVRLVAQVDVKNGVQRLINYNFDPELGINVPFVAVDGEDVGIKHTFEITQDQFALADPKLINHKKYYFSVVSYAYNNYKTFDPADPAALDGQKKPYLQGRNNVKTYAAIPHKPAPEAGGQILGSDYGDGPMITRVEGTGNGGIILDLSDESLDALGSSDDGLLVTPVYEGGAGPVNLKVYDPTLVNNGMYQMQLDGVSGDSYWSMTDLGNGLRVGADRPLSDNNEQILKGTSPDYSWGMSTEVGEAIAPGQPDAVNNGFLDGTISFSDNTARWLTGVADQDGNVPQNWIRSGTSGSQPVDYVGLDDDEIYEAVINGTWAPYKLASKDSFGPKWRGIAEAQIKLEFTNSVDLIITADKSKWTRSPVVESSPFDILTGTNQYSLRTAMSIDKEGTTATGPDNNDFATGMGWFPGYAVNTETGERLNIAYGENSAIGDPDQNAQDMVWNPSSTTISSSGEPYLGGGHYIYIFDHNGDRPTKDVPKYDRGEFIHTSLSSGNNTAKRDVWKDCIWTSIPLLVDGKDFLSSDVHIRLRVARPYERFVNRAEILTSADMLAPNTEYYVVDGSVTYNGTTYGRTPATGSFDCTGIAGGTEISIQINGEDISGLFEYGETDSIAALAIAEAINKYQSVPEYTATVSGVTTVNVTAAIGTGTSVNGAVISTLPPNIFSNVVNMAGGDEIRFTTDATGGAITGTGDVTTPAPSNDFNPMYSFGTGDLAVSQGNLEAAKEALGEIRAVPNPYYAFSAYERDQLDNRVKFTNLPPDCTIRIYTPNGTLVREIKRAVGSNNSLGAELGSESDTSTDWNLKNQKNIPIASGLYLIHVDAPGIGERVIKWFGVMRPVDLDSF